MARPCKYTSAHEQHEARKRQKRAWYHKNKADFARRDAEKLKAACVASSVETDGDGARLSELNGGSGSSSHSSCLSPSERARMDCSPSVLLHQLMTARRTAPAPEDVVKAYTFWRAFLNSLTRGNVQKWARHIADDLLRMRDSDRELQAKYGDLCRDLEHMKDAINKVTVVAFRMDPSGYGDVYRAAAALDDKAFLVAIVVSELVMTRAISARSLEDALRTRSLYSLSTFEA